MIKYFITGIIVLAFHVSDILAQTAVIEGIVLENESSEPLEGATVALYNENDTTIINGAVTNVEGVFELRKIPKGRYDLIISFIGFVPETISGINLYEDVNLGIIKLQATDILMDAVTVTGDKSILTNTLEKKIYKVEEDILSRSGTASDIFQNIPSVSVEIDGNVTLRNSSNITFFINGRPSGILRRNPAAMLEQIPASSIERIEIITNPSAKYRPDGIGGIINIVMKKEIGEGFNGLIGANVGTENRYNGNISLNYGSGDVKFFSSYGIRHSEGTILYNDKRIYKELISHNTNSTYDESGNSKINALSHTLSAGMNYSFDDYNSFEISGNYFLANSFHSGTSDINSFDSVQNLSYSFTDNQTNDEFESEGDASLIFEHKFGENEDHNLTFEAVYSAYNESEDLKFNQVYTYPGNNPETSSNLIEKDGHQEEMTLDYLLPIGENSEFEGGYAGEFIFDDIRYTGDTSCTKFLFDQEIHALYATYVQSIESFSFKAGLRAELTNINSHVKLPSETLVPNDYFKLFPTLHIGYDLDEYNKFLLSYSKRLNRPDADELNPNPEFSDPRNAEAGNPHLNPEQIHSLELGYQHTEEEETFTSTIYYRYRYDAFTNIEKNISDSIVLSTIANLNTQSFWGAEGVFSGKVADWCDYDLTGNVYYTTIDASNLGYTSDKASVSGNVKGYFLFQFLKSTALQLNAFYYFPVITPQGKRSPYFYVNLALKQNLFNNRFSLVVSATDVFHTFKRRRTINSFEFDGTSILKRKMPVVYLVINWNFNNFEEEEKIPYEGEGIRK
jgi:outer membrane receptor protein involved in Fe transport